MKKERKKKRSKQDKGITLVALVVTIIILLILAGVTLNGALSENGLFQRAKRATNEYKKAEEVESNAIEEIGEEIDRITFTYNDYVGCYVDGYEPTTGNCTINGTASGFAELPKEQKTEATEANPNIEDNGDQKFTTEDSMGWRIWDYNKSTNTIRLISSKPTDNKLILDFANGYNNGVWAINEICEKCYGNTDIGATATSLKRSDIQKVSKYDYTKYKHKDNEWTESDDGTIQFGEAKTYETANYPQMWGEHDKNWSYNKDGTGRDKECTDWEKEYENDGEMTGIEKGETSTTFKQSYYIHNFDDENEFINSKYYDLLFKKEETEDLLETDCWLAGRSVNVGDNLCEFVLSLYAAHKDNTAVGGNAVYASNGQRMSHGGLSLRPIVSINLTSSNYELIKEEEGDNENIKFQLRPKQE